jgi:putative Mg2+ transporter-C (MgtC) family protein
LEFSFRLVYAACSAALVGLERSCADRPAGLRTCCLVGLGACIYTISSVHGFLPHSALGYAPGSPMLEGVKCDPSRMAANIASGVGFIGAGMCILVSDLCILSVLATFPDCISD